jgi:hypothetical protein
MNGGRRWEPFTISSSDYSELAGDLVSDHGFVSTPVPRWVVTRNDWHIWIMEQRRGVPSDPHRAIQQQADDAVAAYELARRDPTTPPVVLASRFLEAQRKKDDALHFVDPWITAVKSREVVYDDPPTSTSVTNYKQIMAQMSRQ